MVHSSHSRMNTSSRVAASQAPHLIQDIVEWDVANWSRAFQLWDQDLGGDWHGKRALDLGAHGGGLSLYLSLRGCKVTYLDLHPVPEKAHELFLKHGVTDQLDFVQASVTDLPMADASFDVVAFKSLLASVGKAHGWRGQQVTLAEARRVLRPGGTLLFAENAEASAVHRYCRTRFVPWGTDCRYVSLTEMRMLLTTYDTFQLKTAGLFAAFGRREWQRTILARLDRIANPFFPETSKYLMYGYARK